MDEQEFVGLLQALLQPDTAKVKAATGQLNKTYYKSPMSVTALIHIITSHPDPPLRQLASVEVRKLVAKHWAAVPAEQKPEVRQQLLKSTIDEEKALPRHSKARVIAAIAKVDLADGEWAELPDLLQQAAASGDARHREVGVYIIFTLLETMPNQLEGNAEQLLTLLSRTIQDPESMEVRINSMLALAELAMVIDPEENPKTLKSFQATIPHMVSVLKQAITEENEEQYNQAFDVFNKLLSYEGAFLNPSFGELIHFFIQVASQTAFDYEVRAQAFSFLMQSVRYRKLKFQSLKIGEQITKMCLQVATELEDLNDEDDDITPARSALGLLDILSESLPPSQVAVPLLKAIGPYVQNSDPSYRRAGILALGMCVEGAPDFIATQLKEILPLVLHLLEDPVATVRSAALNGVSRLSDDLAEDMAKEHARLIPALLKNFDLAYEGMQSTPAESKEHELNADIVKASARAVDSLVEGLEPADAAQYLTTLMPRFSTLVGHDDYKIQMAAVGAIGSLAGASGEAFQPYFEPTMQSLGRYLNIKEGESQLELRSMVVDSIGNIASAVGAEPFKPYVKDLMQASEEGLHMDHQRLKEESFVLWSTLVRVYEEDFEPFLQGVVTALFECLEQEETSAELELGLEASDLIGKEVTIAGKKIKVVGAGGKNEGDDDDDDDDAAIEALMDDDDDDFEDLDDFGAVTAIAMEKEIAVEVLGDVLTHSKRKFLPYMEKTIELTVPLLNHEFEGVRKTAVSTLWRAYACIWGLAEDAGMEKWKPGLPLKVKPTADLEKLGSVIVKSTLALWEEEMDRATVTEINRNVAATLKLCGPAILDPALTPGQATPLEQITSTILLLLQRSHPAQKDDDDDEDADGLEESAEYDWLAVETAMEVATSLASALGEQFAEVWKILDKPITTYCSSQERFERAAAVGTLGECIEYMDGACTPYTPRMMTILLKRLSDEDAETKSNAAFGMGLLCLNSNDAKEILPKYNTVLGLLEPILYTSNQSGDDTDARLLDNAAGCVSRMIKKAPQHVPLEQVLPRLVEILPLKEDFRENEPVFDMIVSLYQAQNSVIQGLTPQLMPVFEKVVGPPENQVTEETRAKITSLAQYLQG